MQIEIESTCGFCKKNLDFNENHPSILDKCGHVICQQCKLNSIKSEDEESGFVNMCCPVCQITIESLKYHDTLISHIYRTIHSQNCQKLHEEIKDLKNKFHLENQSNYTKICYDHEKNQIQTFCKQCKTFNCSDCLILHENHEEQIIDYGPKKISSYCSFAISSLQSILSSHQSQIANINKNISDINLKIIQLNQIKNLSFEIESKSLKFILSDIETLVKSRIDLINKEQYKAFFLFIPVANYSLDSLIINEDEVINQLFDMFPQGTKLELIYRGSKDSFKAASYHSKCDNKGSHVTILKSMDHNKIFGAYTDISMTSVRGYKQGNGNTFLFQYSDQNKFEQFKCKNIQYEVWHESGIMTGFGQGNYYQGAALAIWDDCNINKSSLSDLGLSYEAPNGYTHGSNESRSYLAGSYNFQVEEIEVFKII